MTEAVRPRCRRGQCPNAAAPGHKWCSYHEAQQAGYNLTWRAKRKAREVCGWGGCPEFPGHGHTYCPKHREYFRTRTQERRKKQRLARLRAEGVIPMAEDSARTGTEPDLDADPPPLPKMTDGRSWFQKWVDGERSGWTALVAPKPDYVYVASSWRNLYQPAVVAVLRAAGIDCYDFKNPPSGTGGFSWRSIHPNWESWTPAQWREALKHPVARRGFEDDRGGMDRADCCVLVLPSGQSAHMEAAYMAACGKPVFTLALEKVEPDLMNLLLGPPEHILTSMDELFDRLNVPN
jgi:hypothetical protein